MALFEYTLLINVHRNHMGKMKFVGSQKHPNQGISRIESTIYYKNSSFYRCEEGHTLIAHFQACTKCFCLS